MRVSKMVLNIIWYSIFVIPFVYSANITTLPTQEKHSNVTKLANIVEGINITLPSEGGTLLASTSEKILSNNKLTLQALDDLTDTPKETSIKARKGADNSPVHDSNRNDTTNLHSTVTLNLNTEKAKEPQFKILPDVNALNKPLANSHLINSTVVPKKPRILSYETLVSANKDIYNEIKMPGANPSSKTLPNSTKNQIPSPNEEVVKVYPSKANSHPKMIIPIVITMLVLPMFVIIGYLAWKRGQDAWKNRHYKRMDFLLDGMYNE